MICAASKVRSWSIMCPSWLRMKTSKSKREVLQLKFSPTRTNTSLEWKHGWTVPSDQCWTAAKEMALLHSQHLCFCRFQLYKVDLWCLVYADALPLGEVAVGNHVTAEKKQNLILKRTAGFLTSFDFDFSLDWSLGSSSCAGFRKLLQQQRRCPAPTVGPFPLQNICYIKSYV